MPEPYVIAISTTWPPMAAGSGRAFKELISGIPNLVALVPRTNLPVQDQRWVKRLLRFSGRAGGPFKLYTILQHAEIVLLPVVWSLFSRKGKPALVICSQTLFGGVSGLLFHWLWNIPFIVQGHGEEFTVALKENSPFAWRLGLTRLVLQHASAVVCNAHNTRSVLQDQFGLRPGRLYVIHPTVQIDEQHGIDPADVALSKRDLAGDGRMILMVGRLSQERKGFDRAIEALPLIRARVPGVTLVIAGPGDPLPLHSIAQRNGVSKHVVFVGEVERRKLMLLYAACDVFLLPTRTMSNGDMEGFGIVFLEANLMGKPVVGGRSGGTRDAILDGQTGLLVDGKAPPQIADAVTRLLTDRAYADLLGRQGRERVLREFTTTTQQHRFAELVNQVLPVAE